MFISFLFICLSIVIILFNSERMSKNIFSQIIQNHTIEYSEKIETEKISPIKTKSRVDKSFISESILKYYKVVINSYWVSHYRGGTSF